MPRFGETEKENIRQNLLAEGERLFLAHGLKKVTIDDLIEAVNIAKATFYSFYESKEYLYMDIVQGIQEKIFMELETVLENNAQLPSRERVRQIFNGMTQLITQYPILSKIDQSTVDLISRKVKKERMAAFFKQNIDAAQSLYNHGVRFICEVKIASIIFQTLYHCYTNMHIGSPEEQAIAIELMLNAIIDTIVEV
jgi:AcrR family transcriptional regulator